MLSEKYKKTTLGSTEMWIDEEGILIITVKEDADLDFESVVHRFNIYRQMGIGTYKKVPLLVHAGGNIQATPEGRKYASIHCKDFFVASAIVSRSLPIRLLVNFFNSFYKQPVPIKMFESEQAARKWLCTFKK